MELDKIFEETYNKMTKLLVEFGKKIDEKYRPSVDKNIKFIGAEKIKTQID